MKIISLLLILLICSFSGCKQNLDTKPIEDVVRKTEPRTGVNLLKDFPAMHDSTFVNAVIEIPSGSLDKWELNKETGALEWQQQDSIPRIVQYIGYPGNYGMIPQTLLSKENGGDGDPLDVLVLGAPVERGSVIKCKLIGVLYLKDNGEQDDKLIAVANDSPFVNLNSINELNAQFNGVSSIIKTWFANYKGPNAMSSSGFGDKDEALTILKSAMIDYKIKTD